MSGRWHEEGVGFDDGFASGVWIGFISWNFHLLAKE
jgi:hypothetical protein